MFLVKIKLRKFPFSWVFSLLLFVFFVTSQPFLYGAGGMSLKGAISELEQEVLSGVFPTKSQQPWLEKIQGFRSSFPDNSQPQKALHLLTTRVENCLEGKIPGSEVLKSIREFYGSLRQFESGRGKASVKIQTPEWTRKAVVYHLLLDRFYNGDTTNDFDGDSGDVYHDYHGGDFAGVIKKIPYLKELGVNTLWIGPILESDDYHGYRINDFAKMERNFGTEAEFGKLVHALKKAGIRVLVDFVANHSSNTHPYFLKASQNQSDPFYNWYCWIQWPQKYETFFGFGMLPKLNLNHPQARTYVIDVAKKLQEKYPIDGFRLDYATGPGPSFWKDFRKGLPKVSETTDAPYLLGEVWEDENTIRSFLGPLDGCFNFPLYYAFLEFIVEKKLSPTDFFYRVEHFENHFSTTSRMGTFIGNHDMERFIRLAGEDPWKLYGAIFLQMTLSGVPVLYYGDEIEMTGGKDPDNRRDMKFEGATSKKGFQLYKKLIQIRKDHPFLTDAPIHYVASHDDKKILIFEKSDGNQKLVMFYNNNFSNQSHRFKIETDQKRVIDLVSGEEFEVLKGEKGESFLEISCDGHWGRVLKL